MTDYLKSFLFKYLIFIDLKKKKNIFFTLISGQLYQPDKFYLIYKESRGVFKSLNCTYELHV